MHAVALYIKQPLLYVRDHDGCMHAFMGPGKHISITKWLPAMH